MENIHVLRNVPLNSQSGNQAAQPLPTTVEYLLLENPKSLPPSPPPIVSPDNVLPSNTLAQTSKDTVQPSTPSAQSPLEDNVNSTIPTSFISRSKISRTRFDRRLSIDTLEEEYCGVHNGIIVDQGALRALEHSGKYRRGTDRVAVKCERA
ncbi:hypothetical protein ACTXT7_005317 [Hymenolepis weldensis]